MLSKNKDQIIQMPSLNFRLSQAQEEVLSLIHMSSSPEAAYNAVTSSEKHITTVRGLAKSGAVSITDDQIQLTDSGIDLMKNNGLIDNNGELTPQATDTLQEENFSFIKRLLIDHSDKDV